ncbi:MAG: hypothetical protein ACRD8W_02060 [Nitrososphaeraceae archaeon]
MKVGEDKLNQELENTHGDYYKMKLVFEKKINLYSRILTKQEGMTELDRIRLENMKEWTMSHLLSLIMPEDTTTKFSELTKQIYRLEKKTAGLPGY